MGRSEGDLFPSVRSGTEGGPQRQEEATRNARELRKDESDGDS